MRTFAHSIFTLLVILLASMTGCTSVAPEDAPPPSPVKLQTIQVALPSGSADVDIYAAPSGKPQPLVLIAHGFMRSRQNMSLWGRRLAEEGFIAAVPDLPAWADHPRNGRFLNELLDHMTASPPEEITIDKTRIGLMGFSAGGLATLLAAADNPSVKIWIGLDPVDRNGIGAAAAPRLHCRAVILRAPPASANANGNSADIEQALKVPFTSETVPNAVHVDAEWPTDWKAELVCGQSSEERRAIFVQRALAALRSELHDP